jgi:macrolide phosphotransferase
VPFPMLGETQAISMSPLLDDPQPPTDGATAPTTDPSVPSVSSALPDHSTPTDSTRTQATWAHTVRADDAAPTTDGASEPNRSPSHEEAVEESQPVPVMAADADPSTFEIDEVEALPEDADGVLDLHEGASDFVPVEHRPGHPAHD